MDSSVGKVVFCSISKEERILYSYNAGDPSVDSLARLCLSRAPPFHAHYLHTAAGRTFAFLWRGDLTYFLIVVVVAAAAGTDDAKPRILGLLHQIHRGFGGGRAELVAVVRSLVESAEESMGRLDRIGGPPSAATNSSPSSTKAPLLPPPPPDRAAEEEEEVSLEVEADPAAALQQQLQKRRLAAGLWWRHAKIVVVADVAVCGVLFGVWMAVCRGFRCVS